MQRLDGAAPTADESARALAQYEAAAPERLSLPAPLSPAGWSARGLVPRGLESDRIPGVAWLCFVPGLAGTGQDLLVCDHRLQAVLVIPAGSATPAFFPLASRLPCPTSVDLADFDGNGRRDLLVACLGTMDANDDTRASVVLFLQAEDGTLRPHELASQLGRTSDARAADLDGDGDLDVVVSSFGWTTAGALLVLENRTQDWARPSFARHVIDARDGFLQAVPADLDRDGRLDLVALLAQEHEQVLAFLNRGSLTFASRVLHQAPHPAWGYSSMELVDLDRDGDQDVLLANGDTLDDRELKPYQGVSWLEQQGSLAFALHPIAALPGCTRATAGDVDDDGDLDVVATSFIPLMTPVEWAAAGLDTAILAERQGAGWVVRSLERDRACHPSVAVGDLDGDGRAEIVLGNYVRLDERGTPTDRSDTLTVFTRPASVPPAGSPR